MKSLIVLLLIASVGNCGENRHAEKPAASSGKTILALGDSYTIGESVQKEESFPYQLARQLDASGIKTANPRVIARTGWTTSDLIRAVASERPDSKFDVVTLNIGVNNQYSGESIDRFRQEFKQLLTTAISHSESGKAGVFVVSFPDWTVTPFGRQQGYQGPSADVDAFNEVGRQEALRADIRFIDITPGSRLAESDKSLIAADGLHPSGKLYKTWADKLFPFVAAHLQN